jgi:hypothetical protein
MTVDPEVRLVSMLRDTSGVTRVRVRAGDTHGVGSLSRALQSKLPLSSVSVNESWLDGTLEADVLVPSISGERDKAREIVTRSRWLAYPLLSAWMLFLFGAYEYAFATLLKENSPKDEL